MTEATGATTEAPATKSKRRRPVWKDDPEQYRMSIGEHLEELRWRLILALIGFVVVLFACMWYGTTVMSTFCSPLVSTLKALDLDPRLYFRELGEGFMVYLQVSVVSAAALSAPWMLYQLWMFVAAGLYPNERRVVMKFAPFSIGLLISGMIFVYVLVLPWTIQFFLGFASNVPMPDEKTPQVDVRPAVPVIVPPVAGDLKNPQEREIWLNTQQGRIKIFLNGKIRSIPFGPENLLAPQITLSEYINLVLTMLLLFGAAFQLPLVVMALLRIGIVEADTLRKARKIVYFVLLVVACAITPGDMVTASAVLMVPLVFLYELGIILGARGLKKAAERDKAEEEAEKAREAAEKAKEAGEKAK